MDLTPSGMLGYLKSRGCKIGGVTLGERGLVWYDENGQEGVLPALDVPAEKVVDTNGAGDIFHGAYVYSAMARPELPWREHFIFARGASSHAIQHLGNEASLPTLVDIAQVQAQFPEKGPFSGEQNLPKVGLDKAS
jgi:sugar/nucleoside kinase (ribokinase family)